MKNYHVHDTNQNFWELASIQTASFGLPSMIFGWQIASSYGVEKTIGSICVGNLIIWLLGLVVVSMTSLDRTDAIQNVRKYLGKVSAVIAAFSLLLSLLAWYITQLKIASGAIDDIFPNNNKILENLTIRSGAAIGFFSAFLVIWGIRIIKWLNLICLPLILFYQIYAILLSKNVVIFTETWGVSFAAIAVVVLFQLPGTVNLPTFFRHSRSRAHSYLALTLMAILLSLIQMSSIWIDFDNSSNLIFNKFLSSELSFQILLVLFIFLLTICNLITNIYFASASFEVLAPRFEGAKEYAILGLAGTASYTFIQISSPMQFLVNLANYFISSLGVVLLVTFLVHIVVKRRPKTFGKLVGTASLLTGCVTAIILEIHKPDQQIHNLIASMGTSALFFLCVIFIEETVWAIKKLIKK